MNPLAQRLLDASTRNMKLREKLLLHRITSDNRFRHNPIRGGVPFDGRRDEVTASSVEGSPWRMSPGVMSEQVVTFGQPTSPGLPGVGPSPRAVSVW